MPYRSSIILCLFVIFLKMFYKNINIKDEAPKVLLKRKNMYPVHYYSNIVLYFLSLRENYIT